MLELVMDGLEVGSGVNVLISALNINLSGTRHHQVGE